MCKWNWGDITQIIQSICAIGNILLLIYFTTKEWKNAKDVRAEDAREKGRNLEHLWYEKLVIDKVVGEIVDYYKKLQKDLELKKSEDRQLFCQKIKKNFYECKHAIVPYVNIFSSSFSHEIVKIMQNSVDIVLNEMDKPCCSFSIQAKIEIEKDVVEIMKRLHEYDINKT